MFINKHYKFDCNKYRIISLFMKNGGIFFNLSETGIPDTSYKTYNTNERNGNSFTTYNFYNTRVDNKNITKRYYINKKYQLYKTEICRSHSETGFCKYGIKCQFAHDTDELRIVSRHPKYKTETCRTFWLDGSCPYGTRCCFIHIRSQDENNNAHKPISGLSNEFTNILGSCFNRKPQKSIIQQLSELKTATSRDDSKCAHTQLDTDYNKGEVGIRAVMKGYGGLNTTGQEHSVGSLLQSHLGTSKCKLDIQNNKKCNIQKNLIDFYDTIDCGSSSSHSNSDDEVTVNEIQTVIEKTTKCKKAVSFRKPQTIFTTSTQDDVYYATLFVKEPVPFKKLNDAYKWGCNPLFYVNFQ